MPLPNVDLVGPEVFNPDAVPFDKVGIPQAPPFRVHAVGDDGDGGRYGWYVVVQESEMQSSHEPRFKPLCSC
jgi:hypothetical protein